MMGLRATVLVLLGLALGSVHATEVEFDLSDDSARLAGAHQITDTGLELDASWLHHKDDGDVAGVGAHLVDNPLPGRGSLRAGVGGRLYFVEQDGRRDDGQAFALGGKARYTWPTFNRVNIAGHFYFAPDVTAFGDLDSYLEFMVRGEYLVLRNAGAYLGFRTVRVGEERNDDTRSFDSGPVLGIRIRF